jgi:hypothetical protein
MTTAAYAAPLARACIGLPEAEARALSRWLMGNRKGSAGAAVSAEDVARRLRAWIAERRAEEAAAEAWPVMHCEVK